ncbi:hypothetical protein [Rhizobium bangladeshense]|uniref:hypothetical protein n=1 Tax=Rhizobium bangladeshense TaxID=1138189 RepID=UPI001C83292F|nr:hypothetical protein [Rhizobium bangladeshense]MBX4892103.1 hypothetical protein [Rhizobium bangladeshense]MBX4913952.1 hypothetical protein [Rhizobium bangladeshense]MBX4919746.1 hypothetical protein [Rhizobium bangladeshense]
MRAEPVFDIPGVCYSQAWVEGVGNVKRVNLFEYFELAENLAKAKKTLSGESVKGGALYFGLAGLPIKLDAFIKEQNGFGTCKHSASELKTTIEGWLPANVWPDGEALPTENFDKDFAGWEYRHMPTKIDTFRSVFEAECHDVDFYSVGQIAIYKTRDLVANASHVIPDEFRFGMTNEALKEFDDAGRCLAFDLPTACGFHALRGTELVMDDYLKAFGVTKKIVSWNDYIKAAEDLAKSEKPGPKPSQKVTAMLDRMRSLDRNPLMHPRDELDTSSANHLFSLAAVTVAEMIKDMRTIKGAGTVALIAAKAGAGLPDEQPAE